MYILNFLVYALAYICLFSAPLFGGLIPTAVTNFLLIPLSKVLPHNGPLNISGRGSLFCTLRAGEVGGVIAVLKLSASGGMIHKSVDYFYHSYIHLVSTLASMYENEFYDMPDDLEDAQS